MVQCLFDAQHVNFQHTRESTATLVVCVVRWQCSGIVRIDVISTLTDHVSRSNLPSCAGDQLHFSLQCIWILLNEVAGLHVWSMLPAPFTFGRWLCELLASIKCTQFCLIEAAVLSDFFSGAVYTFSLLTYLNVIVMCMFWVSLCWIWSTSCRSNKSLFFVVFRPFNCLLFASDSWNSLLTRFCT